VKHGGCVRTFYPLIIFLFFIAFLSLYGQESKIIIPEQAQPQRISNKNYLPNAWNEPIGSSDFDITKSTNGESLMGNFVCDAMLHYMQTDFAFISYGELYGNLFKGVITRLDLFRLVPFDRTLVVVEISGDTLKRIIEKTLGGVHSGMAISGGKVEYDSNRPARNRLTFAQVGEYPLYPKKIYRVSTIDYLVDGSTGFNLLNKLDQTQIYRTGILLRDMLIDHIKQFSPLDRTKISIDNRWIKK
jgi:2',3'-cyclic-nucleotide 2'-phosphodiesterase (5'-nucleotidase family)